MLYYIRFVSCLVEPYFKKQEAVQKSYSQARQEFQTDPLTLHSSLATAGYGTALGVIRSLHAMDQLAHVFYTETRPYNQGSRLTGLELLHDHIPATLVTDSAAAALLSGAHHLSSSSSSSSSAAIPIPTAVIVGADRVARNGDTANKIGTYALAVLARHHGAAFLVAAPRTTVDVHTPDGAAITVECRPAREMLRVRGPVVGADERDAAAGAASVTAAEAGGAVEQGGGMEAEKGGGQKEKDEERVDVERVVEVSVAPSGTQAWNPAFDVTPAALVDAIVTEVGVVEKVDGVFDLEKIVRGG